MALCDENTIGVVGVLGSTFDGSYEPIKEIAAALDDLQARTGLDVPLHVDAASGGFVAPFLQPDLEWDFRIPRVQSINASGHKYGLVYPGVGWAIWRDEEALPKDLIFDVNYLGGHMPTFALNFSRPGSEVIAQYFMFTSLGREGYRRVMQNAQDVALQLSSGIAEIGPYRLLTKGDELPVFAFTLNDDVTNYSVFDVSAHMRQRGWLIPAYTLPGEPRGPQRAADRRARRHEPRHGGSAAPAHARGDRRARVARRAAAAAASEVRSRPSRTEAS